MTCLSCNTKDYPTSLDSSLSSFYSVDAGSSGFDPKITTLNKYDFYIPGKGEKPVYCQMPYLQGLASDGSGAKVIYTNCGTMGCPSCSKLWVLQRVFEAAVHVEAYSRFSGSRPSHGQGSVPYDQDFTLDSIRKIRRNVNSKLKKQGVDAGLSMFHPFRIKANVKPVLRQLTGSRTSSGFWNFLRDDHNAGNIDKINDILGTDYKSWIDCVFLSPHYHFLAFPGTQIFTGNKDLVLKKEFMPDGEDKIWTLQNSEAVVRYLMYLISHCGQLDNSDFHLKPISPFGAMFKLSAEKLVSLEVLQDIRLEVLGILNQGRDKLLSLDGETVSFAVPSETEEKTFIPISEFRLTSLAAHDNARAFVSGVRSVCPANADYIDYLIDLYNMLCDSSEVPQKFKRLFCSTFDELPDFLLSMSSYSPIRAMFENGLCNPPDSFRFWTAGNVKHASLKFWDHGNFGSPGLDFDLLKRDRELLNCAQAAESMKCYLDSHSCNEENVKKYRVG